MGRLSGDDAHDRLIDPVPTQMQEDELGKKIHDDHDDDIDPAGPTYDPKRHTYANRDDEDDYGTTGRFGSGDEDDHAGSPTKRWAGKSSTGEGKEADVDAENALPAGWLVIVEGPGIGHVATILAGMNVLGRGRESHIVLDFGDTLISRQDHVRFVYNQKSRLFRIVPGMGHHTLFKGDDLMQIGVLERGDLITVGKTVLRFIPFCDAGFDWDSALEG